MIPATRGEARAVGSKHYSPGTECANGHVAPRFTSCGYCTTCSKERAERKAEELKIYYAARYAAGAAKFSEQSKARHKRQRENGTVKPREWARLNPEKRQAISRQYKAKRRSQEEAGIAGPMLGQWMLVQPKVCFYCEAGCESAYHVDHFMPLAKGGAHVLTNLRIACPTCNLRKSAKLPDAWIEELAA